MADINPSTEGIRTLLAETLGRLRKANAEYFEQLEKGLSASKLPVANHAKEFCGYMQRNVTATFDLSDKLVQAKDMKDALEIQSDFFQAQMRLLTEQTKSMGEAAMKAATEAFAPKN
jgi:phasin